MPALRDARFTLVEPVAFVEKLLDDDLKNGRRRDREHRAEDAQHGSADQQREITVTALTPTCRSMTFGTSTWFSTCC